MVGQWQLPGTPSFNLVYKEPELAFYLVDLGTGELQFHADIQGKFPLSRMKHIEKVFITLVAALADKGMTQLVTWVNDDSPTKIRFAEFFGFEQTDFMKILQYEDGSELLMREMIFVFPLDEDE